MRGSSLLCRWAALVTCLLILFTAQPAEAVPRMLRPSTRPWFATFGFGPAIKIDDVPTQFKIEQVIGYHFMGRGSGPAIGGAISQSFGNNTFGIGLGLRFWWDIQPVRGLGLYLAPFMHIGWTLHSYGNCNHSDCTNNYFDWQIGFEPRLVIGDRGIIFWRFFTLNPLFGQNIGFRYDMLFGGGVTF